MTWLIYMRGLREPMPQVICDDAAGQPCLGADQQRCLLAKHRIPDGEPWPSIRDLVAKYPPPIQEIPE